MDGKRYRALLIGNSVFAADTNNLPRLEGPQKDVTLLHHALVNTGSGLFAEEDVRVQLEQAMRPLMEEIHKFFVDAHRNDVLLLYYSGHGLLDQNDRLYLCASDTVSTRLLPTAVSNGFVDECIASSPSETSVVILDCCYSGAFKGGRVPDALAGPGRFVVSSCRGLELANAASAENGTSLFTSHLVDGLLGGAQDRDADGFIDLGEVFSYVDGAMRDRHGQVPQKRFDGDRDVAIARSTARPVSREESGVPQQHIPEQRRPVLALSETLIDLRDVGPDEVLPDEHIAVSNLGEGEMDWTAQSDADWFDVLTDASGITLRLHPRTGPNRGKVLVRDRATGAVHAIRVNVAVRPAATGPPPRLQVWPPAADFGRVWSDQPRELVVEVRNTGGGRLDWTCTATGGFFAATTDGDRLRLRLTATPGRHQGAVTISSRGGQEIVPVTAEVFARQARPQPPPPPDQEPRPGPPETDQGAQTAQTLGIISLPLSLLCGIGLITAVVGLVMAGRAEARIRASAGRLAGADRVRTAKALGWTSIAISAGFWLLIGLGSLVDSSSTTY